MMTREGDFLVVDPLNVGLVQAVAYFRSSVDDGDRRAILMQQDCVRRWAAVNGVEIIREFCDVGPERAASENRPAFAEMLNHWITRRNDFERVLCFDWSRLGRGGEDGEASLAVVCRQHGKRIVVTAAH